MNYLGRHIILDLFDCPATLLKDPDEVHAIMKAGALAMKATIVEEAFHHFSPDGVSGVIIIKESHLTIHTWPEHNYAAVDIFTCGNMQMDAGLDYLVKAFRCGRSDLRELKRGEGIVGTTDRTINVD